MRALVTGGSGFVGSALCARLLALGHEVRALRGPHAELAPALLAAGAGEARGDLADPNGLRDAALGCEVIFHCAGENARRASREALSWINVAGTENLVRAARDAEVGRMVLLSCADVSLANRDRLHWKEDAVLGHAPLGAYARSKLLAEELALHASDDRLTVTALRPAFLWGAGERTLLPQLCREGLAGGVRLFGGGDHLFSVSHVDNVVETLIRAAFADASAVAGLAFHVADGETLTAREFFEPLSQALGLPKPRGGSYGLAYAAAVVRERFGGEGPRPDEVARRGRGCLLDCLRAITTFGDVAVTSVAQGMAALSAWAAAQGGAAGIAKLGRAAADAADVARHAKLADELR